MTNDTVFISSGQVVFKSSKINWPDLNRPNSGETTLRYLHKVNYEDLSIQLDGDFGPLYTNEQLPPGTGFYKRL